MFGLELIRGARKHSGLTRPPLRVLPEKVRFGLAHGEAQLVSREIAALYQGGYSELGFYLTMKFAGDDSLQRGLLRAVAARDFNPSRMTVDDVGEALGVLEAREKEVARETSSALALRRATGVQASKLGEVSRGGFGQWTEAFDPVLTTIFEAQPNTELFMVANAPYIGLSVLASHTLRQGRRLNILRPNRFDEPDSAVGWSLQPTQAGVAIQELQHGFTKPPEAVIFDDTMKSGRKKEMVLKYWIRDGQSNPASFVTAHRINPQRKF